MARFSNLAFVASPTDEAQAALAAVKDRYGSVPPEDADVFVALGGDGLMLRTLHACMGTAKPVFGLNRGTIGFLMNEFRVEGLLERLEQAQMSVIHPLVMDAVTLDGAHHVVRAINEISMLRQIHQAAKLRIEVDGRVRLDELIADGILIATPFGSTAYNLSVGGPILPLTAPLLALTPISAFRPRRWRGALMPDRVTIKITVNDPDLRPVSAVADHTEIRRVASVTATMDSAVDLVMLHDPGHGLDERIIREQFG